MVIGLGIGEAFSDTSQNIFVNDSWSPIEFGPDNLKLWLSSVIDASDLQFGVGLAISQWRDRSGSNNNFVQADTDRQPRYAAASKSITFDSADSTALDDFMTATSQITLDTSVAGWSISWVSASPDWDATHMAIVGDKDDTNNYISTKAGANQVDIKAGGELEEITLDGALSDDVYYHFIVSCSSAGALKVYINGGVQSDTEAFSDNAKDLLIDELGGNNGASQNFNGSIKEIIVLSREVTADDVVLLQEYVEQVTMAGLPAATI